MFVESPNETLNYLMRVESLEWLQLASKTLREWGVAEQPKIPELKTGICHNLHLVLDDSLPKINACQLILHLAEHWPLRHDCYPYPIAGFCEDSTKLWQGEGLARRQALCLFCADQIDHFLAETKG